MEANRKLVGERPGLTRVAVRAGGNHWLEDAQGLPFSCLAGSRAVSLGTFSGPLAGNEQCRRQAGRHGGLCPSGDCLVAGWN